MNKRRSLVLCLIILTVYCGFYLYVRSNHWIVHRSGFAFGNTDNHRLVFGDISLSITATTFPKQRVFAYWIFAPLRYAETGYWYIRYPVGKPWPYYDRSNTQGNDD